MTRVILTVALGLSGIFIATALNPPIAPTAQPATPSNCPGGSPQ